jgi:hypothetical protein
VKSAGRKQETHKPERATAKPRVAGYATSALNYTRSNTAFGTQVSAVLLEWHLISRSRLAGKRYSTLRESKGSGFIVSPGQQILSAEVADGPKKGSGLI